MQVMSTATYFSGHWLLLSFWTRMIFSWAGLIACARTGPPLKGRSASSLSGSFLVQKPEGPSLSLGVRFNIVVYDPVTDPSERKCLDFGLIQRDFEVYTVKKESVNLLFYFKQPSLDITACPKKYLNLWKRQMRVHCQKLRKKSGAPARFSGLLLFCCVIRVWVLLRWLLLWTFPGHCVQGLKQWSDTSAVGSLKGEPCAFFL